MLTKVDELLEFLLNSTLVLPLKAIHTLCTLGSDYKMKNYFTPLTSENLDLVPLTLF